MPRKLTKLSEFRSGERGYERGYLLGRAPTLKIELSYSNYLMSGRDPTTL